MVTTIQHHIEHHVTRLTTLWFHRCYGQGPHTSEDREHHREHSSSFLVRRNGRHWWCEAKFSACLNKVRTDSKVSMFSYVFGGPKYNPPKIDWWLSLKVLNDDNLLLLPLLFALGPRPPHQQTHRTAKFEHAPLRVMIHISRSLKLFFFQPSHCQLRYFFCWRRGTSSLQLVGWM